MGRYRWTHLLQKDYQDRPPFEVPRSVQHCTSRLLYGQFPNKEILCCRGNCRINWTQRVQTELQGHAVLGNRKVRYDRRRYWPRPRGSHANHRVLAQVMGACSYQKNLVDYLIKSEIAQNQVTEMTCNLMEDIMHRVVDAIKDNSILTW